MKCDCCEAEATVHEVTIRHGQRAEQHLCEACAHAKGLLKSGAGAAPLTELLSQFTTLEAPAGDAGTARRGGAARTNVDACPSCGMTFAAFRKAERLGCADCYAALEGHLAPLIERVQEGASHHVGKVPRRALAGSGVAGEAGAASKSEGGAEAARSGPGGAPGQAGAAAFAQVRVLRDELERAVADEQYERAAQIRDEIARLTRQAGGGPSGGGLTL